MTISLHIALALIAAPLAWATVEAPVFKQTLSAAPSDVRVELRRARPLVGPDGALLLHASGNRILRPDTGARLIADRYLRQAVGTPQSGLVVTTDTDWGLLVPDKADNDRVVFRPVAALPLEECRIALTTEGDLLFHGRRPTGGYSLLILDPVGAAPADFVPLLRSEKPFTAVTADKTHAFAAIGDTIHRLPLLDGKAAPEAWIRIPESITEIHADGRGGLAVATATQVLLISAAGETRPILAAKNARLVVAGDTLHILRDDLSALSLHLAPIAKK